MLSFPFCPLCPPFPHHNIITLSSSFPPCPLHSPPPPSPPRPPRSHPPPPPSPPPNLIDPPSIPLDFKVYNIGCNWVNVSWSRVLMTGDYPLAGYEVKLVPHSEKRHEIRQFVSCDFVSVNASGLIPAVRYSASVRALSNISSLASLPSVLVNFTTHTSGDCFPPPHMHYNY